MYILYSAAAFKTQQSPGELLDIRCEEAEGGAEIFLDVEERRPPGPPPPGPPEEGSEPGYLDLLQDWENRTVVAV